MATPFYLSNTNQERELFRAIGSIESAQALAVFVRDHYPVLCGIFHLIELGPAIRSRNLRRLCDRLRQRWAIEPSCPLLINLIAIGLSIDPTLDKPFSQEV